MRVMRYAVLLLVLAFGLLFVTGRVLMSRLEDESPPAEPSDPETSFLQTRSGRVHILDVGSGDPILLLHGSGRSVADWQEGLAERLSRDHRVVAFDNYGFGFSDRNHPFGYGNELWAEQAIDVLDALGIERTVLFGHSSGGVVSAFLAADHPERIRGAVFAGHGMAMDPVQLVPFVPVLGELWAGRIRLFGPTFSDRHREKLEAAYRIRGTRAALLTFIRRQYTIDGFRLLWETYEDIQVPVLQLHGTLDESISMDAARRLTGRMRNAWFVEIEGVDHDIHVHALDRVAAEIKTFMDQLVLPGTDDE